MRLLMAAIIVTLLYRPALAGLTERDLAGISLAPPPEARISPLLKLYDIQNRDLTLGEVLAGRPGLLIPVDYTCHSTCGPALSIVTGVLAQTGLQPGRDYHLIIVGIDPKDGPSEARGLVEAQINDETLLGATFVLTGDATTVQTLTADLGYHAIYDAEHDQFAHPSGMVTLLQDGRISHVLSALTLNAQDLRLALIEGGEGRIGGLADRIMLLCYGFDAVHGVYAPAIRRVLQIAGAGTLVGLVLVLILFSRRTRDISLSPRGEP